MRKLADDLAVSAPEYFSIQVSTFNNAPTFASFNVTVDEDSFSHELQFAYDLSPGPKHEVNQGLNWMFTFNNQHLFSQPPELFVYGDDGIIGNSALTTPKAFIPVGKAGIGKVVFTCAPNASGVSSVFAILKDDGGTIPVNSGFLSDASQENSRIVAEIERLKKMVRDENKRLSDKIELAEKMEDEDQRERLVAEIDRLVAEIDRLEHIVGHENKRLVDEIELLKKTNLAMSKINKIGRDESEVQVFTIEIRPKNDAPYFEMHQQIYLSNVSGFTRIPEVAWGISAGPPNEKDQELTFVLTAIEDAGTLLPPELFFADMPSMDLNGTLTLTLFPRASGSVKLTFALFDNGDSGPEHNNHFSRSCKLSLTSMNSAPSFTVAVKRLQIVSLATPSVVQERVLTNISKGTPQEDVSQEISFVITNVSNSLIFSHLPTFEGDGSIIFEVAPRAQGSTVIQFYGKDDGGMEHGGNDLSEASELTIDIIRRNVPPRFNLSSDFVVAVEDAGHYSQPGFVHDISKGAPDESDQNLYFNVTLGFVSTDLFQMEPFVDNEGTLTFKTSKGMYGLAHATIKLTDSGGTEYDGVDASDFKTFSIQIHPRPKIVLLHPAHGSEDGGLLLTVQGSELSPGTCRTTSFCNQVSLKIGGKSCPVEGLVTPERLTCRVPSGLGVQGLSITVVEDGVNRTAYLADAFVQHDIMFAGLTVGTNEGYIAFGFGGGSSKKKISSHVFGSSHPLSNKGIRAIVAYQDKTYLAGSFVRVQNVSSKHIAAFDGSSVLPLGSGVDGIVNDLIVYKNVLVVGGAFTKVIRQPGKRFGYFNTGTIRSGGLATWDGHDWGVLESRPFHGIVASMHVNDSIIYVGGRFSDKGRQNNLARFNGSSWSSLCGSALAGHQDNCGVTGGEVLAITTFKENLYAGGSFVRAGGVVAHKIARWDGRDWFAMSGFDGDVHSLAILDGIVYAGGVFGGKRDSPYSYLAQWRMESWQRLHRGVGGPVFTLLPIGSCLYVGGSFHSAGGMEQIDGIKVRNAARWCFDRSGRSDSWWSAVQWPSDDIGICRDIQVSRRMPSTAAARNNSAFT